MTPEERYARIDERLDAIAMHLKLAVSLAHASESKMEPMDKRIDKLLATAEKDGEYIRALARIAEHGLSNREGGERKN